MKIVKLIVYALVLVSLLQSCLFYKAWGASNEEINNDDNNQPSYAQNDLLKEDQPQQEV